MDTCDVDEWCERINWFAHPHTGVGAVVCLMMMGGFIRCGGGVSSICIAYTCTGAADVVNVCTQFNLDKQLTNTACARCRRVH